MPQHSHSPVTERDFRKPEFLNADPADYERCGDGTIARKDRWEMGIRSLVVSAGLDAREPFEVPDVVTGIRQRLESLDSPGVQAIAAERLRQQTIEGWTPEHDDAHGSGELARAAACYANPRWGAVAGMAPSRVIPEFWPWAVSFWKPNMDYRAVGTRVPPGANPDGRIRDLAKAGALIAAEIDRLERFKSEGGLA